MFGTHYKNKKGRVKHFPDCYCVTCDRDIHHLGIMSHRAMHRRRKRDCVIVFSDGRAESYFFSEKRDE